MLLLRNKDQQQNNSFASFSVAFAGKRVDMSELQCHYCMTPKQWTWLLKQCKFHIGKTKRYCKN